MISLGLNSSQGYQGLFVSVFGDGDEAQEDRSYMVVKDFKRKGSQWKRRLQELLLRREAGLCSWPSFLFQGLSQPILASPSSVHRAT